MNADIKLDGTTVIVEGHWTQLRTVDLMLDAPSRRGNNAGLRRALVHDPSDGLTINYDGDYPGGITMRGTARVDRLESDEAKVGSLQANDAKVGQFKLASSSVQGIHLGDDAVTTYLRGPQVRVEHDLTVDGDAQFTETVNVHDVYVAPKMTPEDENDPELQPYSLIERIGQLTRKVKELEERLAELGG